MSMAKFDLRGKGGFLADVWKIYLKVFKESYFRKIDD